MKGGRDETAAVVEVRRERKASLIPFSFSLFPSLRAAWTAQLRKRVMQGKGSGGEEMSERNACWCSVELKGEHPSVLPTFHVCSTRKRRGWKEGRGEGGGLEGRGVGSWSFGTHMALPEGWHKYVR